MSQTISDILTIERTIDGAPVTSKKRVLEYLGNLLSQHIPHSSSEDIYEKLLARERLGSTGIGEGIAIPHCRLRQCESTIAALLRLHEPIDFDAIDQKPVDLVFVMLVPEEANEEHLKTLSMIAGKFNSNDFRDNLRSAKNVSSIYHSATD